MDRDGSESCKANSSWDKAYVISSLFFIELQVMDENFYSLGIS